MRSVSVLPRRFNYGNPVNRTAPINRGLLTWLISLPQNRGSSRWLDLTGNYHGTLAGAVWRGWTRPNGWGSMAFAVNPLYVEQQSIPALLGAAPRSYAFWCYVRSTHTGEGCFCSVNNSGVNAQDELRYNTSSNDLYWSFGTNDFNTADNAIPREVWTHVVATYAGNSPTSTLTVKMYINGAEQPLNDISGGGTPNTPAELRHIGAQVFNAVYTICRMDDYRAYARELSAAEALYLYHASMTGYQRELNWLEPIPFLQGVAAGTAVPVFYYHLQQQGIA